MTTTTLKTTLDAVLTDLSHDIDWGNWQHQDEEEDGDATPWGVLQVLYCKLDWLIEELGEDSEHTDTVRAVQTLVEALQPHEQACNP